MRVMGQTTTNMVAKQFKIISVRVRAILVCHVQFSGNRLVYVRMIWLLEAPRSSPELTDGGIDEE